MFAKALIDTPMTSSEANDYFAERITGDSWNYGAYDNTFVATLRALVDRRMPEGDRINVSFGTSIYDMSTLADIPKDKMIRHLCESCGNNISQNNTIFIHNFAHGKEEDRNANIKLIEENFTKCFEGWTRVEKVTMFYRNVFPVLCYINVEKKSTFLFVAGMDIRRLHYLQCGIFAFLPWYFDPAHGATDDEKALIESLREKSENSYIRCLMKIAETYDFHTGRIKKLLAGFETRYERVRCTQIRRQIERVRTKMKNLDDQYAALIREKRENETVLLGLEMKIGQGVEDSEIMDYFLTNRHLILKNVDDNSMDFVVRAPLDYFDEDMCQRILDNSGSYFYRYCREGTEFSRDNIKMLITEIFIKQRLKMQFCAAYRFDLNGSVDSLSEYGEYGAECCDYTPNPHIDRYNCMGNYKRIINDLLADQDYIGAIEQCIASCKSLNFGDSAVMEEFMNRLVGRGNSRINRKCIVMPDGSVLDAKGAIDWLLKEKESQESETAENTVEEATENG